MKKAHGFTLIELMVTIVVAAILLSVGIPSFTSFIQNSRLSTDANNVIAAMNYARSEAIKRAAPVTVNATGGSWNNGLTVVDNKGITLRNVSGEKNVTITSAKGYLSFQYAASGLITPNTGDTLDVCDNRTGETGRRITISSTGHPSVQKLGCP